MLPEFGVLDSHTILASKSKQAHLNLLFPLDASYYNNIDANPDKVLSLSTIPQIYAGTMRKSVISVRSQRMGVLIPSNRSVFKTKLNI